MGVTEGVCVGVSVTVGVGVEVADSLIVGVGVRVGVSEIVGVGVEVGVSVGVGVILSQHPIIDAIAHCGSPTIKVGGCVKHTSTEL